MCELFAMSSETPTTISYSLTEFAKHGGLTHRNRSGWGVAYFQDREVLLIKEPEPAHDSPWVDFIANQPLESNCVIAHVRLATVGEPKLRNTHPFRRALGGRVHAFAHNGTIKGLHERQSTQKMQYEPVGETDSELAFCVLMDGMRGLWRDAEGVPELRQRFSIFSEFSMAMREHGSANFLYSDGDALFVHAHRRIHEEGDRYSDPRPPGLSVRNCMTCELGDDWRCDGLTLQHCARRTVLFASVPLDAEGWEELPEGTVLAVRNGEEVMRLTG